MEENSGEISEIQQTWNKIETTSRKTGLREGISDGKESRSQEYFNIGFKEGFKNGYALGKYKGFLDASFKLNNSEGLDHRLLENNRKGNCEVCKNEEILEQDITTIINKQTEVSNKSLEELYASYKDFSCDLPKSLGDA